MPEADARFLMLKVETHRFLVVRIVFHPVEEDTRTWKRKIVRGCPSLSCQINRSMHGPKLMNRGLPIQILENPLHVCSIPLALMSVPDQHNWPEMDIIRVVEIKYEYEKVASIISPQGSRILCLTGNRH